MNTHISRTGVRRSAVLLCLALVVSACSTAEKAPDNVARLRNWNFISATDETRIAFVPKGAYVIGLNNQADLNVGQWVRIVPGEAWPKAEPKPSLLIGRIVERQKSSARIEMLALQPGMRDIRPDFEIYPIDQPIEQMLHAMTKRLTFASGQNGDVVFTPMNRESLVNGNEIYGAIDLSTTGRLANATHALLTIDAQSPDDVRLVRKTGKIPASAAFVLLDAPSRPGFDVTIQIGDIADRAIVVEKLNQLLKDVPGSEYIRIGTEKVASDLEKTIQKLGATQTESLHVILTVDKKQTIIIDQALRVTDAPFTVVLTDNNSVLTAVAAAARSLEMLGYPASAAYLLEKIWSEANSVQTRAAVAPALASMYHRMERDDWALEIGLELKQMAGEQSKSIKAQALAAAAAAFAIAGRSEEFSDVFDAVHKSSLPVAWQKIFAHSLLLSQDLPKWHEYFAQARKSWHEFDEMQECFRTEDEDACQDGLDKAQTEIGKLWFQTEIDANREPSNRQIELARKIDAIGAPNLAMHHWMNVIESGLNAEASSSAWIQMAEYAKGARQIRAWLHLMFSYAIHQKSFSADILGESVRGWMSLDWRHELAHACILRAKTASPGESVELLELASELYVSIGDAENASTVAAMLSRIYAQMNQPEKADLYRNRARAFDNTQSLKEVNAEQ